MSTIKSLRKYERHTDTLVYNSLNFNLEQLKSLNWLDTLEKLKFKKGTISRVFLRSQIKSDGVRTPTVEHVWDDGSSSSTVMTHTDNGITYKFDLTKNMFARGNIQEKIRMSEIKHA